MDVPANFNVTGDTYYYVAFLEVAGKSKGDSYSGNGSDNRNYTGVGFQPEALFIFKQGDTDIEWKTNKITTDNTMYFTASASAANLIQSFAADGFQLGSSTDVNASSTTYFYMALGGSEVAGLPIELFPFDARCSQERRTVDVDWTSASEVNNDYYTVERSIDGIHFESVGIVAGAGNSNEPLNYHFEDEQPVPGVVNYYRLRQTDYDDKSETFKMMAASCLDDPKGSFEVTVLQNGNSEQGIIYNFHSAQSCVVSMKLHSLSGQLMDEHNFYHRQGIATYYRNTGELAPGIYLMTINNGFTQKTVKILKH